MYDATSCLAAWYHVPPVGLSGGGSVQGGSLSGQRRPYGEEWAVCILVECFLVIATLLPTLYSHVIEVSFFISLECELYVAPV